METLLASYGLWIVLLATLLDQLGAPIPAPPTLVLAGSLIGAGQLDAGATLAVAVVGCLPADWLWFEIGRRRGHAVLRLLCRISLEPDSCVRSTSESFARRGPATLLFAKFVPGLQTIAPPMAGATGVDRTRFLAFDTAGATIWSASFLAIGALLHEQIDAALEAFTEVGGRIGALVGITIAAWIAWKFIHRQRFLRSLRAARISPDDLHRLYDAEPAPMVFDLRHPSEVERDGSRLPGARWLDPGRLAEQHEEIPRDRDIVLYCT